MEIIEQNITPFWVNWNAAAVRLLTRLKPVLKSCRLPLQLTTIVPTGLPHKLSEGKFVLLFLLQNVPDGLSPHELSERAGVTRATITGLLDGLERDGFLKRHADTQDRRKLTIRLTSEGARLAQQLFVEHTTWIASLMSDLSADEQSVLSTLLRRIFSRTDAGRKP